MNLKGKDIVVVGLGRSGVAAANLCADQGARVVATDRPHTEARYPKAYSPWNARGYSCSLEAMTR